MKIYDNIDQLTPDLVGTVITFKTVEEKVNNPTRTTSLITAKLVAYVIGESEYTQGNKGVTRSYQILFEGYPTIKEIGKFEPSEG